MNMQKVYYSFIFRKNVFPTFLVSFIFRNLFRLNKKSKYLIHFTNKVAGVKPLEILGTDYPAYLSLLSNTGIFINTSGNGVKIHSSTYIAAGVKIYAGTHDFHDMKAPAPIGSPVEIGANCWLGANSIILPEVKLGPSTIVGAGTVVTKSYPNGGVILVGSPAKILVKSK